MAAATERRPLGELFSELASETATLVRHEVELAKVETVAKIRLAGSNAAVLAVGGAVAFAGGLVLLAALILILALAIPLWSAALVVGMAVTLVGGLLVARSLRAFKRIDPVPRETIQTIREDKQWLREQVNR
jgi:hypothetical protein